MQHVEAAPVPLWAYDIVLVVRIEGPRDYRGHLSSVSSDTVGNVSSRFVTGDTRLVEFGEELGCLTDRQTLWPTREKVAISHSVNDTRMKEGMNSPAKLSISEVIDRNRSKKFGIFFYSSINSVLVVSKGNMKFRGVQGLMVSSGRIVKGLERSHESLHCHTSSVNVVGVTSSLETSFSDIELTERSHISKVTNANNNIRFFVNAVVTKPSKMVSRPSYLNLCVR